MLAELPAQERRAGEDDKLEAVAIKRSVASSITRALIEEGYWTVLSHSWSGVGVPAFMGYDREGNYPRFRYLTRDGRDQAEDAYGVLTPYAFYHNISTNHVPDTKPTPNEDASAFYASIFHRWRDQFDFDFVRHDYVDHVFDSIENDDPDYPCSDRPTPSVLRRCIEGPPPREARRRSPGGAVRGGPGAVRRHRVRSPNGSGDFAIHHEPEPGPDVRDPRPPGGVQRRPHREDLGRVRDRHARRGWASHVGLIADASPRRRWDSAPPVPCPVRELRPSPPPEVRGYGGPGHVVQPKPRDLSGGEPRVGG